MTPCLTLGFSALSAIRLVYFLKCDHNKKGPAEIWISTGPNGLSYPIFVPYCTQGSKFVKSESHYHFKNLSHLGDK